MCVTCAQQEPWTLAAWVYVDDADSEEDREVVDVAWDGIESWRTWLEASGLEVPPDLNKR